MSHRNLITMIHHLAVGNKRYLIAHIKELMKDPKNNQILDDLTHLLTDVDNKLTQSKKYARMGMLWKL